MRNEAQTGAPALRAPARSEVHHAVADHFRKDPELPALGHHPCGHHRDESDAELERGAVDGEGGHALPDGRGALVGAVRIGVTQGVVDLDHPVEVLEWDFGVAQGVGHLRVHLAQHQPAAGPHALERSGQDVDLDPEGHHPIPRKGGVEQDRVGRPHRLEETRHEREAHGQVVERRDVTHSGSDEGRLADVPGAVGQRMQGIELEDPAPFECRAERAKQRHGGRGVPRYDDPRFWSGEPAQQPLGPFDAQRTHRFSVPRRPGDERDVGPYGWC